MSPIKLASVIAASMLVMGAGTAFAKNDSKEAASASGQESQKPKKTDVGPRDGFPENHGMEVAREHANEHAAFNRHDSPGT